MKSLSEIERDYVLHVLKLVEGNKAKASKILKISIRKLRYLCNRYEKQGYDVPINFKSGQITLRQMYEWKKIREFKK